MMCICVEWIAVCPDIAVVDVLHVETAPGVDETEVGVVDVLQVETASGVERPGNGPIYV